MPSHKCCDENVPLLFMRCLSRFAYSIGWRLCMLSIYNIRPTFIHTQNSIQFDTICTVIATWNSVVDPFSASNVRLHTVVLAIRQTRNSSQFQCNSLYSNERFIEIYIFDSLYDVRCRIALHSHDEDD